MHLSSWRRLAVACLFAPLGHAAAANAAPTLHFDPPLRLPAVELIQPDEFRVIADLDGDGLLDIAVSGGDSWETNRRVRWLRGLPGARFDLPRLLFECEGCNLGPLRTIDAVGDPGVELVFVAGTSDGTAVRLLDLDADGRVSRRLLAGGAGDVLVADVDLDGHDDLVVLASDDSGWTWRIATHLGRGDGTFRAAQAQPAEAMDRQTFSWMRALRDLDGDGIVDLALGRCPLECVFYGDVDGTLRSEAIASPDPEAVGVDPGNAHYADVDQDGRPDRLHGDALSDVTLLSLQLERGQFFPVAAFAHRTFARSVGGFAVADMDNNGLMDLVWSHPLSMVVRLQTAPGTFHLVETASREGQRVTDVVDLDGDGCLDVVEGLQWYRGRDCGERQDVAVSLGFGQSAFVATATHREGTRERNETLRVVVAPSGDGAAIGLPVGVLPPPGCTEVPSRWPRRTFDCALPTLSAGESVALRFDVKRQSWQRVSAVVLRHGGEADADAGNDRAVGSRLFAQVGLHRDEVRRPARTLRPAPSPPARPGLPGRGNGTAGGVR